MASPPVLAVVKIPGCPACNDLQEKFPAIMQDLRSIPGLASLREEVFILPRDNKIIPYALRTVSRVPMLFLVPGRVWDDAKRNPDANVPLEASTIYNGEWVHHKPVFTAEMTYIRKPGDSVTAPYRAWVENTLKLHSFQRVQSNPAHEAVHARPPVVSSSSSSHEAPVTKKGSSSSSSRAGGCKIQIIRYTSTKSRK